LLAALAVALGTALGLGLRSRLLLALALVVVYVPLAGAGPSIQRAGIMGGAALVAALAGRPSSRAYALLLAAAVTLLANPRAAADPGWQLSFAAVIGIALGAGRVAGWLRDRRVPRGVADATAMTVAATVATRAADRAALRSRLADRTAGERAGGAGGRARHVAGRARRG
jgi:competence protein ComEC